MSTAKSVYEEKDIAFHLHPFTNLKAHESTGPLVIVRGGKSVSTWIEAGLAPKPIQTFAGHSSLQVTMDRYGHLFPSDNHKAAMDEIAGELIG